MPEEASTDTVRDCPHCGWEDLNLFHSGETGPVLPYHPKPNAKGRPGEQVMCPAGGSPFEVVQDA